MNNQIGTERERAIRAVEAFLEGLVKSSVDGMPLISPLDPANPKRGREQASNFLNLAQDPCSRCYGGATHCRRGICGDPLGRNFQRCKGQ